MYKIKQFTNIKVTQLLSMLCEI